MSISGTCFRSIAGSNRDAKFLQTIFLLYLSLMLMFTVLDVELDDALNVPKSFAQKNKALISNFYTKTKSTLKNNFNRFRPTTDLN